MLAANSNLLIQFVLGGFGVSGVVGAVIAIYKLRPDVNSAAVVQAQGTMEAMQMLIHEQRLELEDCREQHLLKAAKIIEQENLINQLRQMVHGAAYWEEDDPQLD